jgi:arsenate reductase
MDVLLASKLVTSRKVGRWIHYQINPNHFSAETLSDWFNQLSDTDLLRRDLGRLDDIIGCQSKGCRIPHQEETHMSPGLSKKRILFLCTGNSCRSQMAEGWTRHLLGERYEVQSVGTVKHGLNPHAVAVMSEAGVDISSHYSKTVSDLSETAFDYVITVCDNAREACPFFPAKTRVIHVGFQDPPAMAAALAEQGASLEKQLDCYRLVRDQIKSFVQQLPEFLEE